MKRKCWIVRDQFGRYYSMVPVSAGQPPWTTKREDAIEFSSKRNALLLLSFMEKTGLEILEQYPTTF